MSVILCFNVTNNGWLHDALDSLKYLQCFFLLQLLVFDDKVMVLSFQPLPNESPSFYLSEKNGRPQSTHSHIFSCVWKSGRIPLFMSLPIGVIFATLQKRHYRFIYVKYVDRYMNITKHLMADY